MKTHGVPSTRPVLRKLSTRTISTGSQSSNTMPASSPSWLMPRSVKPSCANGAEQTRSLLTQRRNLRIVSHAQPHGDSFKLLGICFDCKLRMDLDARDVVSQASWKLTTILRTRRFHGVSQLEQVYKSKVLSFVEYRTPAVFHTARTTLAGIDAVQRRQASHLLSTCSSSHDFSSFCGNF